MNIGTRVRSAGSNFIGKEAVKTELALKAKSGSYEDEVMIRISDLASFEKDELDATKLEPLTSDFLALSIPEVDEFRAIQSIPNFNSELRIPVVFDYTQSGEVTFSLRTMTIPDNYTVVFSDVKNGVQIPVTDENFSYTFNHVSLKKASAEQKTLKELAYTSSENADFEFILTLVNTTAVEEDDYKALTLSLNQNYPNPFNPSTTISFSLANAGNVSVRVFDSIGRQVALLNDGQLSAGVHQLIWDASSMSSGIYFYQMHYNGRIVATKKMTLLK